MDTVTLDVVDRRVREILYSAIARAYGVPTVPDDHHEAGDCEDDE